jgi:hypothetical protein
LNKSTRREFHYLTMLTIQLAHDRTLSLSTMSARAVIPAGKSLSLGPVRLPAGEFCLLQPAAAEALYHWSGTVVLEVLDFEYVPALNRLVFETCNSRIALRATPNEAMTCSAAEPVICELDREAKPHFVLGFANPCARLPITPRKTARGTYVRPVVSRVTLPRGVGEGGHSVSDKLYAQVEAARADVLALRRAMAEECGGGLDGDFAASELATLLLRYIDG